MPNGNERNVTSLNNIRETLSSQNQAVLSLGEKDLDDDTYGSTLRALQKNYLTFMTNADPFSTATILDAENPDDRHRYTDKLFEEADALREKSWRKDYRELWGMGFKSWYRGNGLFENYTKYHDRNTMAQLQQRVNSLEEQLAENQ
jgi:hypothetical protein